VVVRYCRSTVCIMWFRQW